MAAKDPNKKKKPWVRDAAIYSALRRAYGTSPAINECMNSGKEEFFILCKNGNQARRVRYKCEKCDYAGPKAKKRKPGVAADHIEPIVDPLDGNLLPDGTRNWTKQIDRLFVGRIGLQRLCHTCHSAKSKAENALRKKRKA